MQTLALCSTCLTEMTTSAQMGACQYCAQSFCRLCLAKHWIADNECTGFLPWSAVNWARNRLDVEANKYQYEEAAADIAKKAKAALARQLLAPEALASS